MCCICTVKQQELNVSNIGSFIFYCERSSFLKKVKDILDTVDILEELSNKCWENIPDLTNAEYDMISRLLLDYRNILLDMRVDMSGNYRNLSLDDVLKREE